MRAFIRTGFFIFSWACVTVAAISYSLEEQPLYEYRKDHDRFGLGKFYMGREIAHYMSHQGAAWLERSERETEENTRLLVDLLKLKPGETVADVGAGTGYISRQLAGKVGPSGKVYAVEIQQEMLDILMAKNNEAGITNIMPILGNTSDPKLPPQSVDTILMVDVYHEFDQPFEMMRAMLRALKPGGRIVFVEYRAEDPSVPIKAVHKMAEAQVRKECAVHPLEWVETLDDLPRQHLIVFKKNVDAEPQLAARKFSIHQSDNAIVIRFPDGRPVLRYALRQSESSPLTVPSACYFHPLATPGGIVMTDVAPADHRHHRGIFFAWLEMHGQKSADFWGWGKHAPATNRVIVNRKTDRLVANASGARFRAENVWLAENTLVLSERLSASVHQEEQASILNLTYTLKPSFDLTLPQWAFSGFCVRSRLEGTLEATGPEGAVGLGDPHHLKPESNWAEQRWYGYAFRFNDGFKAGLAVINHPNNPPTTWHNSRKIRMLNPCVVAPGALKLKAHKPVTLRYRVVACDGEISKDLLNRLSKDW